MLGSDYLYVKRYTKQLIQAIRRNQLAVFCSILETKIPPSNLVWIKYYMLLKAVHYDRIEFVRLLLDVDCPVNLMTDSETPLHIAVATKCSAEIIEQLLNHGASISAKDSKGDTPLHVAFADEDGGALVDLLLDFSCAQEAPNVADQNVLTFLHIACTRSRLSIVHQILELGADAECQVCLYSNSPFAGYTPLHFAAKFGNLEIADLLIHRGVSMNLEDAKFSTPIHLACENRKAKMVDFLFEYDCERKNLINSNGLSHFMAACMGTDYRIVEELLHNLYSAEINFDDFANSQVNLIGSHPLPGYTPLHFAAEFGRLEIFEILLEAGADCLTLDAKNRKPVELAETKGHLEIVAAISGFHLKKRKLDANDESDQESDEEKDSRPSKKIKFNQEIDY